MEININVRQLVFDLAVSDQATAISVQNRISAISNDIAACLESVLEKYDDPDAYISIHRLELNLGPIDGAHLEEELLQGVAAAIHKEMAQLHVPAPMRTFPGQTPMRYQTLVEHEEDVIRHFLSTGLALDQTTDLKITKTRIRRALYEIPALVEWFIRAQRQNTNLLKRLLYHLDDSEVHALVVGRHFLALERVLELIQSLPSPGRPSQADISHDTVRVHFWRCVFNQKADGRTAFDHFEFIQDYARQASVPLHECICSLPKPDIGELLDSKQAEMVRRYLRDYGVTDLRYKQEEAPDGGDRKSEAFDSDTERPATNEETKLLESILIDRQESKTGYTHSDRPVVQETTRDGHIEMPDKFCLHNGGIVLVAPFLGRFFKSLGFIENDQFVDREKQERSVVLLHYLHPWQEVSEDGLILNKLLCGLDIIDPVPIPIEPTVAELEGIDELIQSVIHHWSALKETSVRAFKDSFMNRAAILRGSEHQWHLQIKRESIDVLLETLPWSIAVIKHPCSN